MTQQTTTSAFEAIKAWHRDGSCHSLNRAKCFYGPDSVYSLAIDEVARGDAVCEADRSDGPALTRDRLCGLTENPLINCIARLRAGADFDADEFVEAAADFAEELDETDGEIHPTDAERQWFKAAQDYANRYGWQSTKSWSIAAWRMLSFVNDHLHRSSQPVVGMAQEGTPIFLASEKVGRVLRLVAERVPGPKLVTPHWWRLGLVPLGDDHSLVRSIHHGLNAGLDGLSEVERFQIRWWLEEYPNGGGWHDEIRLRLQSDANQERQGSCDSAHVAAACLALALRETEVDRPLLDEKAGVSATLPDAPGVSFWKRPVGRVGQLPKKLLQAELAEIQTFVLEEECSQSIKSEALSIQPVTTLGEAYDALLRISPHLQTAKRVSSHRWGQFIEKQIFDAEMAADERGPNYEIVTAQEYIDASRKRK